MSEANLTKLLYCAEDEFGVTPSPAPTLKELRYLSSGLDHEKLTVMSEEIRVDRARSQLIQVGKDAAGPIETEFIVGAYNDFILAALMQEEWTEEAEVVAGTIASAGGNTWLTRDSGTFSAAQRGAKFVRVGNAATSNSGIKRVVSWTDTVVTWQGEGTNEAATPELSVRYARNGLYKHSFLIEHQYLGLDTPKYAAFLGCSVDQWTLGMEAQARVMQTFQFMGTQAALADATAGDGSPQAHSTREICNTTGNVGGLMLDDASFVASVMSFDMTLSNNLRNRPAIGRETTLTHGRGRSAPDGTLNAYFTDTTILEKFLDHESAALLVPIVDAAGNLMSVFLPHIEFPDGWPTVEGIDTDLMLAATFNATLHTTLGYAIQVDQLDVATSSS